jgi:ABC-type multidrug transport system fused ATPase/permease subunit
LEAKSPLYTQFIETLSGLITIRSFGWSEEFLDRNLRALDHSQQPYYLLFCIQRWLSIVLDVMVAVLAVVLMILIVELRDSVGAEYTSLALLNIMSFSASLTWIVRQWTSLETSIGAVSRVKTFTSTTPTENLESECQRVPENWPDKGGIVLKAVSASYSIDGTPILRDINMDIKPGEKIGICGRTGSGKSSLIMTLLRLLETTPESTILIDGVDISRVPRQVVRSGVNAIPQDVFVFKGSIRQNSSPSQMHSDEEIIDALRKVHLWSLVQLKGGLDVGLDADFFSPGQKQLFCLARALLRKGRIIVMDEVSSSIDISTDKVIQEVIRKEFEGATIISIAHRLDSIIDFDRIAVLSDGRLVEFDTPQALLSEASAFRNLYNP